MSYRARQQAEHFAATHRIVFQQRPGGGVVVRLIGPQGERFAAAGSDPAHALDHLDRRVDDSMQHKRSERILLRGLIEQAGKGLS
jgi:hypothetical protein